MKSQKTNTALEKYLSQVDRHLKYMPVSEKADILSELKNTFYERMENGQSEEEIIAQLESPKTLAASYISQAITKNRTFSWRRFMMLIGFYSFASTAWMVIIPTTAALAVSFFFSSGVSVLVGVMGLIKGISHIPLIDDIKFTVFIYEIEGIPALIVGLLFAVIFLEVGILCWKGTVGMVRLLQAQKWKLDCDQGEEK